MFFAMIGRPETAKSQDIGTMSFSNSRKKSKDIETGQLQGLFKLAMLIGVAAQRFASVAFYERITNEMVLAIVGVAGASILIVSVVDAEFVFVSPVIAREKEAKVVETAENLQSFAVEGKGVLKDLGWENTGIMKIARQHGQTINPVMTPFGGVEESQEVIGLVLQTLLNCSGRIAIALEGFAKVAQLIRLPLLVLGESEVWELESVKSVANLEGRVRYAVAFVDPQVDAHLVQILNSPMTWAIENLPKDDD
jgi:hypothetical protein